MSKPKYLQSLGSTGTGSTSRMAIYAFCALVVLVITALFSSRPFAAIDLLTRFALLSGLALALGVLIHAAVGAASRKPASSLNLAQAMQCSSSPIIILDGTGTIEYANDGFSQLTGYRPDSVVGRTPEFLADQPTVMGSLRRNFSLNRNWHGDLCCRAKDGSRFWVRVSVTPMGGSSELPRHFCCIGEDITESKATQRALENLAFHDVLTGLDNRRVLLDRLSQSIKACRRNGTGLAVMYLDLDHFKRVNDTLGHDAGDTLLCSVADTLRSMVRAEDTVARLGGDEFVILLKHVEHPEAAGKVATKILQALSVPVRVNRHNLIVTASIGIACFPSNGEVAEELIKNADMAMYLAKENGRSGYRFFNTKHNYRADRCLDMGQDLSLALATDQLQLYFQPQVRLADQKIVGLEALLRWNHPTLGLLAPQKFMEVAERAEMMIPMGTWVLEQAVAYLAKLANQGLPQVKISINLSASQLTHPDLPGLVEQTLIEAKVDPRFLCLEITEDTLMKRPVKTEFILKQLKNLGVELVMDNFGTGSSSLGTLKRLPLDLIKVDRSFVNSIPANSDSVAIATAAIAMAHKLNLTVLAEGVETPAQLDILNRHDCDLAQGYLFCKPLPMEKVPMLFNNYVAG